MGVPLRQQIKIGLYILGKKLRGERRYPLVLMLEPLFRCNLACAGCGKIDYPPHILDKRISVADALEAVEECGAPVVSIAGGEPLLHKEMDQIVAGFVARKKFVYLCTNALLLEQAALTDFTPSKYFTISGSFGRQLREHHDRRGRARSGTFDHRRGKAIREAQQAAASASTVNCTLFQTR